MRPVRMAGRFSRRLALAILAGWWAVLPALPSGAKASEPATKAELKERKRYCKILERQLKPDVKIGASGNTAIVGFGGRFELDYPNDLKNEYLAAHTDHAMACGQWRRGKISTDEYRKVRERWIAVYMAGTDEGEEAKNRAALEAIVGSMSKFGFSDERKAELAREFEEIRTQVSKVESETGNRSRAILSAISDAQNRFSSDNQNIVVRLASIETTLTKLLVPPVPDPAMPLRADCNREFTILFGQGSADVEPGAPSLAQAAACGRVAGKLVVVGYADSTSGSARANLRLSAMRAASVAQALTALGAPITRLSFVGGTNIFGTNPQSNRVVVVRFVE